MAIVAVVVYVVTVVKAVSVATVVDAAMLTAAPARAVMGLAAEVHVGLASAASLLSAAPWNFVPDAALTGAVLAANVSPVPQSVVARIVVIAAVGASARKRRRNAFVGVIIRISTRKTITLSKRELFYNLKVKQHSHSNILIPFTRSMV